MPDALNLVVAVLASLHLLLLLLLLLPLQLLLASAVAAASQAASDTLLEVSAPAPCIVHEHALPSIAVQAVMHDLRLSLAGVSPADDGPAHEAAAASLGVLNFAVRFVDVHWLFGEIAASCTAASVQALGVALEDC